MSLPTLRFRSLQTRIVVVFLLLLLTVQALGYTLIHNAITDSVRRHARDELEVGERVFRRLLAQSSERLAAAAQALASDFALREAIATRDKASIAAILRRHRDRTGADLVMLLGTNGQLLGEAIAPGGGRVPEPVAQQAANMARSDPALRVGMIGDEAYRLVAVPVHAAVPLGWVVSGLRLDAQVLNELATLTNLDVSVATRDGTRAWRLLASTLPADRQEASLTGLPDEPGTLSSAMAIGGAPESASLAVPLGASDDVFVTAVLQRSLDAATAPFRTLQTTLLALTVAGLLLAAIGSVVMARRITGPVSALVAAARKIEEGDYQHRVPVSADEIGELASAFNHMSNCIAAREGRISELAYADPLTGLPNRALFNDRLAQAVSGAQRSHGRLAVLTLDLDRFKQVNDTLGHHMGDLLLREVAHRLHHALQRRTDTLVRLGGDEFAVLLPTEDADGAVLVARKIVEVLSEPLTIEGHLVDVGASTGIAVYPEHGNDAATVMRCADVAMYAAKRAGTGYEVYDARLDENTPARLSLLGELRQAVEHDELALFYQPKIGLRGKGTNAAEALVRWNHPVRGLLLPESFVPFAEQTGYIRTVTRWVLGTVFRQCAAWRARGLELRVSVNISARDLHNPDFPRSLAELASVHQMTPEAVSLEVTESAVMEDPAHALEVLNRLHAMGVRLSIDDFGTGYSSLAYLKRLPVDELKIDKSFVQGLVSDPDDAAIVRATIDLAHHMGLAVTAEGVEDPRALEMLRRLGCDLAQGHHIGAPMLASELERWSRQHADERAQVVVLH
jgi:diguanylate cyclase (GGDEF)-like protein